MSPPPDADATRFGAWRLRVVPSPGLGLVVDGLDHDAGEAPPADYVDAILLSDAHRERFFDLIDHAGLVVCRHVGGDDASHRDVRGRSSRGRLSPGEYFHHDGCSGPIKPRVVEIRCPYQTIDRHTSTAIAPFPAVVDAMLHELPARLRVDGELAAWHGRVVAGQAVPIADADSIQGAINRTVRRGLTAEEARAYFRAVDLRVGAYREAWTMGESRFIANANPARTMQHRRAYLEPHTGGRPNGRLVKRWPAGPELGEEDQDGASLSCAP
jgi:hypothetical protein